MAETYFEKTEREIKDQQARDKQAREHQEQQQQYAADYLKQQEELKKMSPEKVQQNVESVQTPEFRCIAQSHAIFQNATPEQKEKLTAEFQPQDNRDAVSREVATTRFSDQLPVEHSKTTNIASHLAQSAYERRMDYLTKDQEFGEKLEAEKDPVQKQHLELQRALATETYEASTAHSASNVSRLVGDKENGVKFAAQATNHEVERDALQHRLREFEQAHGLGEFAKDKQQEQPQEQKMEQTQGQRLYAEFQQRENAKAEAKGISGEYSADQKKAMTAVKADIQAFDQSREQTQTRERDREQER